MKTIILFSPNKQFLVELKCDVFSSSDNLTIMEIVNRSDSEVKSGLDLKLLPNSIEGIASLATSLNLNMDIVDIDINIPIIHKVTSAVALSVTSTGALEAGSVGVDYFQPIIVSGGNPPYLFEVTSGDLPSGLFLNSSTGYISGTPDTVENPTFEITVSDSFGQTDSDATLSIDIS